uniref:hypothetical protein n=1 Tax=Salinibacterium sp. TaxID=1915057 RepID=UPI00286BC13D
MVSDPPRVLSSARLAREALPGRALQHPITTEHTRNGEHQHDDHLDDYRNWLRLRHDDGHEHPHHRPSQAPEQLLRPK